MANSTVVISPDGRFASVVSKPRSSYTITTRPGFICLADKNEGRSLTNDAESVLAELASQGYDLASNRVIYRDTRGILGRDACQRWVLRRFPEY
jgi:hypothetical protein